MRRSVGKGFTIIELMVVLVITLIIMGMLTTIFVTTTKVVNVVELKLRVNEQARGILDTFEEQLMNASANERGGNFVVKGAKFTDGDPSVKVSNNAITTASTRYADTLNFAQTADVGRVAISNYPLKGGYPFPFYKTSIAISGHQEFALNGFLSNIHYAFSGANSTGSARIQSSFYGVQLATDQTTINNDISRITYELNKKTIKRRVVSQVDRSVVDGGGAYYTVPNSSPHSLEPGFELRGIYSGTVATQGTGSGLGYNNSMQDVHVLDFAVSVWDETDRKFHRIPHLHAVYFAPIPKAVLVTITVCDIHKKGRASYSRIMHPRTGTGSGHFDATIVDTGAEANALATKITGKTPSETVGCKLSLPLPYNRLKELRVNASTAGVEDFEPTFLDANYFK
jgi:prepilin-type N-terminal cleavage/methylation domain-containing protein